MNLSAYFCLYHLIDFYESLGKTDFKSIGLTCVCHHYGFTCPRNLV